MRIKPYLYKPPVQKPNESSHKTFPLLPIFLIGFPLLVLLIPFFSPQQLDRENVTALGSMSTSREYYDAIVSSIRQDPTNPQHYLELARLFLATNQDADARRVLEYAGNRGYPPDVLKPWEEYLDDRAKRPSMLEQNLADAQTAVEKDPQWRDGWMLVAQYAMQLKNFDEARQALKKVLDIDPNFQPAKELLHYLQKD